MNKKIFSFVLILVMASFILSSCRKCQKCTETVETDVFGVIASSSATEKYCGDEYDDAPAEVDDYVGVPGASTRRTIVCTD